MPLPLQAAAAGAHRLELVSLQADVLQQCGEAMEALAAEQLEQVVVARQQASKAAKRASEELEQSNATVAGGQAMAASARHHWIWPSIRSER